MKVNTNRKINLKLNSDLFNKTVIVGSYPSRFALPTIPPTVQEDVPFNPTSGQDPRTFFPYKGSSTTPAVLADRIVRQVEVQKAFIRAGRNQDFSDTLGFVLQKIIAKTSLACVLVLCNYRYLVFMESIKRAISTGKNYYVITKNLFFFGLTLIPLKSLISILGIQHNVSCALLTLNFVLCTIFYGLHTSEFLNCGAGIMKLKEMLVFENATTELNLADIDVEVWAECIRKGLYPGISPEYSASALDICTEKALKH